MPPKQRERILNRFQRRGGRSSFQIPLVVMGFLLGCFTSGTFFSIFTSTDKNDSTLLSFYSTNYYKGRQLDYPIFSNPEAIPLELITQLDAILVLGGGVPESIQSPPVYVQRRCDDAAQVVKRHSETIMTQRSSRLRRSWFRSSSSSLPSSSSNEGQDITLPILCLSAGTAHLPQLLGHDGLPVWESTSCAGYLAKHYQLSTSVYVETSSYDTIGNAFYARTSHTDITGWRRLLIVTNEFHMTRTKSIFEWIFHDLTNNRILGGAEEDYQLYYLSSPNIGLDVSSIDARRQKEEASNQMVHDILAPKYRSLQQVHWFLTHNHSLYTSSKLIERGMGTNEKDMSAASLLVKQSYGAVSVDKKDKKQ